MTRMALLLAFIVGAGCAHRAPEYRGRPRVTSAQLVAVNPDVKAVADADQPLFFARGFFWLFHDGTWWRGERATSEVWVQVDPPVPVKQILNPYAFTNYRRTDTTRTAIRETPSGSTLQRSLVRQSKVAEDEAEAAAKQGKEPEATPASSSPTQRSTDPSDPATTDAPGL